jgi:AcrR family transcriptional regulator
MSGADTAELIRRAAVRLFLVQGYAGLSMQQVRREAGVSNGSLYHQFPSKAILVGSLMSDGMRQCQELIIDTLDDAATARDGIVTTVQRYVRWVESHQEFSALLFADLPDEALLAAEPIHSQSSRRYARTVGAWLRRQMAAGALRERPFETAHALWLGPTQELCRHWVRGRSRLRPTKAAGDLMDGAWNALSTVARPIDFRPAAS